MKKILKTLLILAISLGLVSCGTKENSNKSNYQKITPTKAKEMIDSNSDVIILDVRTQEEFAEKRIANSILIPYDEILKKAETVITDKNTTILVYCRSGRRSALAAKDLVSLGYTKVYDFGGIIDWPYDTISD